MISGYCTNLPSSCVKAAKKELIPMSATDTKCPECGSGLIAAKESSSGSNQRKVIIGIGFLILVICIVLGINYLRSGKKNEPPKAPSKNVTFAMRISGSNTIGSALAPRLVESWLGSLGATAIVIEQRKKDGQPIPETIVHGTLNGQVLNVEIRAHGSGDAFKHLLDGSADIGMSSRPIKPEEKSSLTSFGDMNSTANEHVIALDGIAIIVAPGRDLKKISRRDLARVFSGEISDWSQLGSGSGVIQVYARDEKSGTFDTFKQLVLNSGALVSSARRFEDSGELEAMVSKDTSGIGFVGLPYVKNARAIPVSDGSNSIALSPTVFTVKKEDYPLARRLFLYTAANPSNQYVRQFVRFVQSEPGQKVVKTVGFVDQNLNMADAQQNQAQENSKLCTLSAQWPGNKDSYCRVINGKTDLGTSFRFRTGSSELDNRAVQDLQRVLELMAKQPGSSLTLVGFADSQGNYSSNIGLSEARAKRVKEALLALGINNISIQSFGQEIPVADNETPNGKERNRRVEVWVK
jgi:phosphate transport system substrate-binding protein